MTHSAIFKPISIRGRALKSRVVFGAHTANMAENGYPGAQHRGYYEERAIGGAGMIVVEPMPVHRTAVLTQGNFRHDDDSVIPHFAKLVECVKQHGGVIVQQLYHVGQHGDADLSFQPNWSPSGLPSYHDSDGSHAMSVTEIDEIVEGHVEAALRCQKAGFDGVEIWNCYHSMIDQFLTPWSNHRCDEYGGSLENRMRFGTRIFEAVRAAVGEDFIVGFSLSVSEKTDFMLTLEDYMETLKIWDAKGYFDYVSVGSGNYIDYDIVMPTFLHGEKLTSTFTASIKEVVKNAYVISESHIRTPENANAILASGDADLVSIVRGQIADPHLVNKARDGRDEDVRGCISCNQMCWGRRSRDYWISCLINPSAGREYKWGGDRFTKVKKSQEILVVGGGPAGMETARVAAERGHTVTLTEASGELGGNFRLGGMAPRRGQMLELIQWYEGQFEKLGVTIKYNAPMDADDVLAIGADQVVLATGSMSDGTGRQRWLASEPELPGLNKGNVWSPEDVMRREAKLGDEVLFVDEGGSWRGTGTAWHLAQKGHKVTIVTPDAYIGKDLARTTADFAIRQNLKQLGATFMTDSVVAEWHGEHASVQSMLDGSKVEVTASAIVMATTNMALNDLELDLVQEGACVKTVGDCVAPRNAAYAFYEGRKLGLEL